MKIKNFKELFKLLPRELQKRVYDLKKIPQNPKWHPEGNTLKHTIVVVNRALKYEDIDLAIAAIMHDIGKDITFKLHPKTGLPTAYGHEFVSAKLVKKYESWIKSLGGNVDTIYFIVKNHMRYKQLSVMRPHKQAALKNHPDFDKLCKFGNCDRGGLTVESSKLKDYGFSPIDLISNHGLIPLSTSVMKQIYNNQVVSSFHITDLESVYNFKKLEGSKKSISTFNKIIDNSPNLKTGHGGITRGGVLVWLEGDVMNIFPEDVGSRLDSSGRRWVSWQYLMADFNAKLPASLQKIRDEYEEKKEQIDYHKPNPEKILNKLKAFFVDKYIKETHKQLLLHRKIIFRNRLKNPTQDSYSALWNEVVLNNVKIRGLFIIDSTGFRHGPFGMGEEEFNGHVEKIKKMFPKAKIVIEKSPKKIKDYYQKWGGWVLKKR